MAVQSQTSTRYPTLCGWCMVTDLPPTAQAWPLLGFLELEATPFLQRAGNLPVAWDRTLARALQLHPSASQPREPSARWALYTAGAGLAQTLQAYASKQRSSGPSAKNLPRSIV